jgi:hypothetical protein
MIASPYNFHSLDHLTEYGKSCRRGFVAIPRIQAGPITDADEYLARRPAVAQRPTDSPPAIWLSPVSHVGSLSTEGSCSERYLTSPP